MAIRHPAWRMRGHSGTSLSADGLVTATFDGGRDPHGNPQLLAFVVGDKAIELQRSSPDAQRAAVITELSARFDVPSIDVIGVRVHTWSEDPWSAGCFGNYLPPGVWMHHGEAFRRPHGPVHFAGTETADSYFGSIEGAVSAAERVACDCLADPRYLTRERRARPSEIP